MVKMASWYLETFPSDLPCTKETHSEQPLGIQKLPFLYKALKAAVLMMQKTKAKMK